MSTKKIRKSIHSAVNNIDSFLTRLDKALSKADLAKTRVASETHMDNVNRAVSALEIGVTNLKTNLQSFGTEIGQRWDKADAEAAAKKLQKEEKKARKAAAKPAEGIAAVAFPTSKEAQKAKKKK